MVLERKDEVICSCTASDTMGNHSKGTIED